MEIDITNLRAEVTKGGDIAIYFTDGRIAQERILLAVNQRSPVEWVSEDGINRVGIQ